MDQAVPTALYRTISEIRGLKDLSDYLVSATRYRPVLIITGVSIPGRINYPAALAAESMPEVDVYWVPGKDTQWRLSEALGDELKVFAGAARMIWPRSEGFGWKFFLPPRDAAAAGLGLRAMEKALATRPNSPLTPVREDVVARVDGTLADQVARLQEQNAQLRADLASARSSGRSRTEQITKLQEQNTTLRRTQRNGGDSSGEELPVYGDPGEQFRHEVWLAYLRSVPEPERDTWELRDYRFGVDWFATVDTAERRKVVGVVVEILTRRAGQIPGRQVRQHHDGPSGKSNVVVRADGSTAWRANLQTHSPAARRIMWWELPDGTVELAKVATHDDCKIR